MPLPCRLSIADSRIDSIIVAACTTVALLDEKRMKKPMRDFTLLVGSSFFHGFRKCIVRASTSSELLKAVMSALESQGVHIPPEAFPMQILHRDTEFQEALPVADLDMLNGKARVRLEQASPKDAAEQSVAAREGDFDAGRTGDSAQASASATPEAEIEKLRRSLQEAEARAASAAALQEQCDTLSNSLAAVRLCIIHLMRLFIDVIWDEFVHCC
eukprot:COSAG02_NODE_7_length_64539_cov_120.393482_59_plen_215_part_00